MSCRRPIALQRPPQRLQGPAIPAPKQRNPPRPASIPPCIVPYHGTIVRWVRGHGESVESPKRGHYRRFSSVSIRKRISAAIVGRKSGAAARERSRLLLSQQALRHSPAYSTLRWLLCLALRCSNSNYGLPFLGHLPACRKRCRGDNRGRASGCARISLAKGGKPVLKCGLLESIMGRKDASIEQSDCKQRQVRVCRTHWSGSVRWRGGCPAR